MAKPVKASNLIDASFFVGEINIPNTQKPEIAESLNLFISKYEPELLRCLMGHELYTLYATDSSSQRFQDMIYGEGIDDWRGLVYDIISGTGNSPAIVKGSLIAYYVYTFWIKDKQLWNSGVGIVRAKGDSTEVMPISLKMVEAWNTFSHQVEEFAYFIGTRSDVYPEWSPISIWQFKTINDFDI